MRRVSEIGLDRFTSYLKTEPGSDHFWQDQPARMINDKNEGMEVNGVESTKRKDALWQATREVPNGMGLKSL